MVKEKTVPLKGGGFEWTAVAKDHWHGKTPDGKLPPRIKQLDAKTFCCYRDGKYLGSEPTMKEAFERIKANCRSDKSIALAIWIKHHPDELPPFLNLTEEERAHYWTHNPPKGGTIKAPPAPSRGVVKDLHERDRGVVHHPPHPKEKESFRPERKRGEGGNKDAEIAALLKRGCTSEEVLRVTGWKAVSMPAMAKKLGLALRIEKGAKPFKYYGSAK